MTARAIAAALTVAVLLCDAQVRPHAGRRWQQYEREMQTPSDDPPDAWTEAEFAFARLRYRSLRRGGGYQRWGIDTNKSDRIFSEVLRRLTRINTRSVEQIVDVDSDEMFDWPFLYAVSAGDWRFNEGQAERLKKYFERGGFLMVDDFHGEPEWDTFMEGMNQVLPGAAAVEVENRDPLFHVVYDLTGRVRVPGYNVVFGGQVERGGVDPHWRAINDEQGRVRVAICFNMDLGDAWEFADDPGYPEEYASMSFRMGVNYIEYAMSH